MQKEISVVGDVEEPNVRYFTHNSSDQFDNTYYFGTVIEELDSEELEDTDMAWAFT
jgi:hypothetical protein